MAPAAVLMGGPSAWAWFAASGLAAWLRHSIWERRACERPPFVRRPRVVPLSLLRASFAADGMLSGLFACLVGLAPSLTTDATELRGYRVAFFVVGALVHLNYFSRRPTVKDRSLFCHTYVAAAFAMASTPANFEGLLRLVVAHQLAAGPIARLVAAGGSLPCLDDHRETTRRWLAAVVERHAVAAGKTTTKDPASSSSSSKKQTRKMDVVDDLESPPHPLHSLQLARWLLARPAASASLSVVGFVGGLAWAPLALCVPAGDALTGLMLAGCYAHLVDLVVAGTAAYANPIAYLLLATVAASPSATAADLYAHWPCFFFIVALAVAAVWRADEWPVNEMSRFAFSAARAAEIATHRGKFFLARKDPATGVVTRGPDPVVAAFGTFGSDGASLSSGPATTTNGGSRGGAPASFSPVVDVESLRRVLLDTTPSAAAKLKALGDLVRREQIWIETASFAAYNAVGRFVADDDATAKGDNDSSASSSARTKDD